MRLNGKVAIVTGSAAGIGKAIAEQFAKEGAKVVVAARKRQKIETVDIITKDGGIAELKETDVSKEEDVKSMVDFAINRFGKVDILVNNAGIELIKPVTETTIEEWNEVMDINLRGVFLGCKYVIPEMIKAGEGSIINIASISAILVFPSHAAYDAAKGGVITLTKQMALDYASQNIRINCICPGGTDTEMVRKTFNNAPDPKEYEENIIKMIPMLRLAKPEEMALAALFLASDESSYITGHSLVVDGGFTIQIWPKTYFR